jgi:ribosomal protein S25
MGITQIKELFNRLKDGHTLAQSDAHSSRPSTSQNDELTDQVQTSVKQDRHVTVRELVEEVGISTGSVHFILTDDLAMQERGSCNMTMHQLIPCNSFKLS